MDNRVKFYSWLIGLLDRKHLTFEEIANEWRDANANQDEDELDKRTFIVIVRISSRSLALLWNATRATAIGII